ncbi:hypothetical protein [Kitasatospora herbaricolor]|uniref:DUF3592 domain-containing protein n=1 Tax=Kitasatospora herbaricolor TaxID=68217 RepID=A0ABZ1WJX6_9ACTN|nr:hypothetical protein [Kitasatospora herbaricolor]
MTVAWAAGGLLWLRVVALWVWWSDDNYFWMARLADRRRTVSLVKGSRLGRIRSRSSRRYGASRSFDFEGRRWVYVRQSAVWLLLPLACAALAGFGQTYESETVRSVVRAGASVSVATVVEAHDVVENTSEGSTIGYFSKLTLALPGGGTISAEGAYTPGKPEPDDKVEVLWAPSAPELGGRVHYKTTMSHYLDQGWGLTLSDLPALAIGAITVLAFVVTLGVATREDGLHDLAWRPVSQTVHAVVVSGVLLAALPYLAGTATGSQGALGVLFLGSFALLVLYIGMHLRLMLD